MHAQHRRFVTLRVLPLRVRLTVWYGAVLAATLLLFSGFLQFTLTRELSDELDRSLRDRAVEVQENMRVEVLAPRQGRVVLPDPDVFATGAAFIQIVDNDGQIAAASANLGNQTLPLTREALNAGNDGKALFETVQVGPALLRLYSAPLRVNGAKVGVLQVARGISPVQQAGHGLRTLLLIGGALSVGVSLLVGGALAGAALAPINRITQTAQAIGAARDFSRRVTYDGPADEVGRLAATFNDMLEQVEGAYAEQQAANERLAASLASQRRFVADASHELRTPLTTIRGNAGLLRREPPMEPEDREDALEQIASESERMSRLVSDLLTLARADAGRHIPRGPVALRPLVEDVWRQTRLLAGERVRVELGAVCDATVAGAGDSLKQLLLILVDNAIKYTPTEGRVRLSLRADGARALMEVADTGAGIAPEDMPHIFERFYRADRARRSGGTGLGLSIARWIADEHGGDIQVVTEPGHGSVFTVAIPLAAPGPVLG